ncbi:MAG: AbgT family transporter [Halothermotrichaceae bacterium]
MSENTSDQKFTGFINKIEVIGNKLPHPFWLFVSLSLIILFLSFFLARAGVSVSYLDAETAEKTTVTVNNLLDSEVIKELLSDFTSIYTGFAPLGIVMVMMLGIGVLEQSGMLSAGLKAAIIGAPAAVVTAAIAFAGVNANLASDAGIVVVATLGGAIFKAMGRKPWLGVITGYAAANGGFGANMFIAGTDALLAGITESASANIDAPVHPLMNWYFMIFASIFIIIATVIVTEKFTRKRLGDKGVTSNSDSSELEEHTLDEKEKKALKISGIVAVLFIAVLILLILPQNSIFRADDGSLLPNSPLLDSIVSILFLFFCVVGFTYGKISGSIKDADDIPDLMKEGLSNSLSFIVVALPASIFVHLLYASELTTIIGAYGGQLLQSFNLEGVPLLIVFILLSSVINIFVTSGSAKWLILAPVFVPMFSQIGWSPALTQISYRVADSATNIISPIGYYLPVIMGLLETYKSDDNDQEVGIGTVISYCLPYSIAYFVVLVLLLMLWFVFKLPLGPGVSMFL